MSDPIQSFGNVCYELQMINKFNVLLMKIDSKAIKKQLKQSIFRLIRDKQNEK